MRIDTEIFFRPDETGRAPSSIRGDLYNSLRRALARSVTECAFVPVRNMQILAVVTRREVIFVDNLNYAVSDGQGGRLVMLAWDLARSDRRDSLDGPVPVDIVKFHPDADGLHARLVSEFPTALATQEKYERNDPELCAGEARIIPYRQ